MESFESHRSRLYRLAYQMLGGVADAEDAVQETGVRWHQTRREAIEKPGAWLAQVCTRICLDKLRAAQRSREEYVGEWLPEVFPEDSGAPRTELDEDLSMALLRTMQALSSAERAAFLLHDVFGHTFAEVAEIVGKRQDHCRQLAARARSQLRTPNRSRRVKPMEVERLTAAFFQAIQQGNLAALQQTLAAEVVLHSDGGGKAPAARRPIHGMQTVARFFDRVMRPLPRPIPTRRIWFNGAPGVVVLEHGRPTSAFQFEVATGQISAIHVQRNPDKLAALAEALLSMD